MSTKLRLNDAVLFDGFEYYPKKRHSISIFGDRIVRIEAAHPPEDGETVIDLGGKTLMPGLIDAHFHANSPSLNVAAADRIHPSHLAQYARRYLEQELQRGFTTVRDAGGADVGIAKAVEEGLIQGPRLLVSGRALSQTGGHGDIRDRISICGCNGYMGSLSSTVDGADDMRRQVRNMLHQGVHQIKLMMSGGVLSPTDPIWMDQFTDEEVRTAVEEANRWRTYVMAHAHTSSSIRRCVSLGIRSIEHATLMDEETATIVSGSESYIVPTLLIVKSLASGALALPPGMLDKAKQIMDAAAKAIEHGDRAGVRFGLGTDLLGELHGGELQELTARADISGSLATLRSATSINAEILGMKDEIGAIRLGARADLLIIDGDPVANIAILAHPDDHLSAIIKDGAFVVNRLKSHRERRQTSTAAPAC